MSSKRTLDTHYTHKVVRFQEAASELANLKSAASNKDDSDLNKRIETLEKVGEEEVDFYINTASILFNYYNIVENNTDDSSTSNIPNKGILKFFVKKEEEPVNEPKVETHMDKATLLENYVAITSSNYFKKMEDENDACEHCGSTNRVIMLNDSIISCNDCNNVEFIIVDHDKPSYKESPREVTYYSYRRINHLNEWISQIQGKETTDIPEEVYDKILFEIKKQRIVNMATLTTSKVRSILKKLKLSKYYEHTPHIIHRLNGLPIPNFEPELEERLRTMFKIIQPLFLKHMPRGRKNFLSYSYILYKFIQLLGRDEFLTNFNLLKNREKLHDQDQVWKKICTELDWEFIKSV